MRSIWRKAFYKKNGSLRPDFAQFILANPSYVKKFPELRRVFSNFGLKTDIDQEMYELFMFQQAELTPQTASHLIENFAHKPLISIIMPVYNTPTNWLRRAVESVQKQYYQNWELCVIDDCSPTPDQRELLRAMAMDDARIKLAVRPKNGGISAASNMALEMAQGEFIALVDHDDEITPDALLRMVSAINDDPKADFLYSDHKNDLKI